MTRERTTRDSVVAQSVPPDADGEGRGMTKEGAMIDRGGHVRLLPTREEPVETDSMEWTEEIPESELPPNAYQERLSRLHEAEAGFVEELAATASDGVTPIE